MNLDRLLNDAFGIYHQYPIVVASVAVVLIFLVYKNVKASFKIVLLFLFLAAFFYAISLFGDVFSTGAKNRDQMINKTRKLID